LIKLGTDFEVGQKRKTVPFRFTFGTNNLEMIPNKSTAGFCGSVCYLNAVNGGRSTIVRVHIDLIPAGDFTFKNKEDIQAHFALTDIFKIECRPILFHLHSHEVS
jgi:hypothetical protein